MKSLNEQYFKTQENHKNGFKKSWWILWIGLLFGFIVYVYLEVNAQMEYPGILENIDSTNYCIDSGEFKLGNISYDGSTGELDKPIQIKMDSLLNTKTWIYDDVQVETVANHIYYLKALNNKLSTPSGLTIGQTKTKVAQILFGQKSDFKSIAKQLKNMQLVNCESEKYLIIEFQADTISKLEMGIDLP